jgi:hypothetical protein
MPIVRLGLLEFLSLFESNGAMASPATALIVGCSGFWHAFILVEYVSLVNSNFRFKVRIPGIKLMLTLQPAEHYWRKSQRDHRDKNPIHAWLSEFSKYVI